MSLDEVVRFLLVPSLGLWAFQQVIREIAKTVSEWREGLWN